MRYLKSATSDFYCETSAQEDELKEDGIYYKMEEEALIKHLTDMKTPRKLY